MQMKNVLDRLTELAKENPSPDVKQAMENTRRMSVAEGADVVEIHEGVAEAINETEYPGQLDTSKLILKSIRHTGGDSHPGSPGYFDGPVYDNSGQYIGNLGFFPGGKLSSSNYSWSSKAVLSVKNPRDPHLQDYWEKMGKDKIGYGNFPLDYKITDLNDPLMKQAISQVEKLKQGVAEGGKTPKQYWNRDSQSIGSTPDDGLTYADPDEDGVQYPDYGNTKFQQQAKPKPTQATSANKRLTDKQYAKQLHKHYAPLYDTLRITFNRRKNIFSVTGDNGFETDYHKYRVDPTTNKLKIMMSTSVENESVNPGVAEGLGTSPDRLLARTGMNNAHKFPRDGQTDLGNIPGMNTPGASEKTNKYADQQRAKRPGDLKAAIKGQLGKHHKPNLPEQSVTEGVNFAEMHREQHSTLEEMLNELHDDINTFKECGHMSEKLRDFMEVHHYGKKQLMDAAYGPVDELADMTKLAGVPGPIGQPGEELAESPGIMIDGKEVDIDSLALAGVDYRDAPDYSDAYLEDGNFVDGTMMSADELRHFMDAHPEIIQDMAYEQAIGAGDDYHDRQQDMELDEVSDGDNGLADAHANARQVSGEHGVAQHVNRDPESGYHRASDWYVDGETVASYNNGKSYDDTGYLDEEDELAGDENSIAQKAQGIEAVTGQKITQLNPTQITQAGQKVDAIQNVREGRELVDECDMTGSPMQPNTPANINISASAASGDEVASMIGDLLRLAGRPESVGPAVGQPGIMAIDSTMDDGGGAAELAAMLNGDAVVDEAGEAGGFADATTTPDELVYGENPVLTQTGVQKHSLGGYRNGDSPLAAATELEESLWRKFQNQ